jgi:Flp pilus assembly protein TadG
VVYAVSRDSRAPHSSRDRRRDRGQSVVEFALLAPVLLFVLLAIADFARLYTTMITVESAAREGADFGAVYRWNWEGTATDASSNHYKTVNGTTTDPGILGRACNATSHLPEYAGPDTYSPGTACTNPTVTYDLIPPAGVAESDCPAIARDSTPCQVAVELQYRFDLISPMRLSFGGTTLGLPESVTFSRRSVFAVSDFAMDELIARPATTTTSTTTTSTTTTSLEVSR